MQFRGMVPKIELCWFQSLCGNAEKFIFVLFVNQNNQLSFKNNEVKLINKLSRVSWNRETSTVVILHYMFLARVNIL